MPALAPPAGRARPAAPRSARRLDPRKGQFGNSSPGTRLADVAPGQTDGIYRAGHRGPGPAELGRKTYGFAHTRRASFLPHTYIRDLSALDLPGPWRASHRDGSVDSDPV